MSEISDKEGLWSCVSSMNKNDWKLLAICGLKQISKFVLWVITFGFFSLISLLAIVLLLSRLMGINWNWVYFLAAFITEGFIFYKTFYWFFPPKEPMRFGDVIVGMGLFLKEMLTDVFSLENFEDFLKGIGFSLIVALALWGLGMMAPDVELPKDPINFESAIRQDKL